MIGKSVTAVTVERIVTADGVGFIILQKFPGQMLQEIGIVEIAPVP